MTEPTKGPWVWRHDYEHRNIYGSDTRMVATTAGVAHDAKEIHANALLIAAAPDLLAALENLVDDCGRFDAYDCAQSRPMPCLPTCRYKVWIKAATKSPKE